MCLAVFCNFFTCLFVFPGTLVANYQTMFRTKLTTIDININLNCDLFFF